MKDSSTNLKETITIQEILQILANPKKYCSSCLKIKNKRGEIVPLIFNHVQERVYQIIQKLRAEKKPIKLIILKARQQGISTESEALIFHDSVTRHNRNSLIMAHDPESTRNIFEMNKLFYDELPKELKPLKRYDNTTRLVFDNPDDKLRDKSPGLRSQITVATANKRAVGRGITLHNFHGSEVAFWNDASETMLAVNQAIPGHEDTITILESTANGVGGYFYDTYWAAKEGKNDYIAIFLPWFEFSEYSRPIDPGFVLTKDEEHLKAFYNLTNEQINWRRWAIANKCEGDEMKFKQEYPSSDVEAFIVSGTPKFNMTNLHIYYENRKSPIFVGELDAENTSIGVKEPKIRRDPKGRLKIYQWANPKHSYVIGGDVAKGTKWSDFCSLQVIDRHTGDPVAHWYGKIDPTLLAYEAAKLGYLYKGGYDAAFIGIEVNKDGITTNKILYHEIKYPRLYRRRTLDDKNETVQPKLGFHTNERSRPLILNKLARWINEGEMSFHDEETIKQCMTFTIAEDGKPQAQEGCYDDAVMALAIAIFLYEYTTEVPKEKTPQERNDELLKQKKAQPHW